jgi:hypothetical protein
MQNQSTSNAQENARTLRREMTDSERKRWSGLRSEQGVKFRRQHPLGNCIADFACRRAFAARGSTFCALDRTIRLSILRGCFRRSSIDSTN